MDKFEPDFDGGEMKHTKKAVGELVVAGGDGSVDLEMSDLALDPTALAVELFVPADRRLAVRARRDDRANTAGFEIIADGVAVVAFVGQQRLGRTFGQVDHRVVALAVRRLAAGEVEGEWPAVGITDTMNFTGKPAPRPAKSLFASPPLAPAADTWPRTVVESML